LLKTFAEQAGTRTWEALVGYLEKNGLPEWFKRSLDAVAITIAGALNVEGIANVVVTGYFSELPRIASDFLLEKARAHSMWSRLGEVHSAVAARHRMAGMVFAGIDRVLLAVDH
jgi:hypothetical protein